jgi:hypothetical protein
MMMTARFILTPPPIADVRSIPDKKLIRAGLLLLLFMTTAFGAATWNAMQDLASQIKAIPVALFVIVCILVARLYAKVDDISLMQNSGACAVEPALAPSLAFPERNIPPLPETTVAQVPLETRIAIWSYWGKNGTGRRRVEHVQRTYDVPANVVQHLLERYDVQWREQVAMLYLTIHSMSTWRISAWT